MLVVIAFLLHCSFAARDAQIEQSKAAEIASAVCEKDTGDWIL